mgnify:FL=1
MEYCGFFSGRLGSDNQTRGLILEAEADKKVPVTRNKLLQAPNGQPLDRSRYPDEKSFKKDVYASLDAYLADAPKPDVFVLPFNHGDMENAPNDADTLAKTVKDYYGDRKLGNVTTLVLTGAFHDYRHVDLANVPYHLMTEEQAKRLDKDPELQKKIVPTLGVAGNLTELRIRQEGNRPAFAEELAQFKNGKPTVFFSLGGRVEGPEIQFTMQDAENIWKKAREFQKNGFNVALGNSPRTPTDVTDYLFEQARDNGVSFYNAKKIAETDTADFRQYTGKYKKEFAAQQEKIGNIYPAILSVSDIVVGTKDSFSYTSDTAALGIKTAVYSDMHIDPAKRPDCDRLLNSVKNKYVYDLNDPRVFDPKETLPVLPQTNATIINAVKKFDRQRTAERLKAVKNAHRQTATEQNIVSLKLKKDFQR